MTSSSRAAVWNVGKVLALRARENPASMASIQQPEVLLAQRLASNEKPVRTKALRKLKKYISAREGAAGEPASVLVPQNPGGAGSPVTRFCSHPVVCHLSHAPEPRKHGSWSARTGSGKFSDPGSGVRTRTGVAVLWWILDEGSSCSASRWTLSRGAAEALEGPLLLRLDAGQASAAGPYHHLQTDP